MTEWNLLITIAICTCGLCLAFGLNELTRIRRHLENKEKGDKWTLN